MSSRQPISHFGKQAVNSVQKQRSSATQKQQQHRATPTGRPSQGKLTFKQPDAPRIPSSPIVIDDDDSTPAEEPPASWERGDESFFYEPNRGPYDETWRPMEQDQVEESEEDESVAPRILKARHQPQRIASARKIAGRTVDALQPDAMGMWTPPASNARMRRAGERVDGRRGSSLKGKEKAQTPATSDPVETPVHRGPSTTATSSKTPSARPRTEPYVEVPPLTARTAALRPPTQSAGGASANSPRNVDQQGRQWLKKRTIHDQAPQKRRVQTKMTNFINDGPPTQSGSAYRAPIHDPLDEDFFEQSVQFVKARISGYPVQDDTATARSRLEEPFRAQATVSIRPQPQRKKRKSDEISTGSDVAEKAITNDAAGGEIELLASRPTAHKRFRLERNDQSDMQDPPSNDRLETSSLTSLSKDPSSELDIDQEVMKSGLKVIRGRGMNMVMNTVYSSDADVAAAEERDTNADEAAVEERNADVDMNEDQAPVDRMASSTRSSVVPSSQPWERHESQPWYYHLQAARFKSGPMIEPAQDLNYRSSGIPLRTDPPAAEEHLLIVNTELAARPGPSTLSVQRPTTLTHEQDVGNTRAEGTSRRSAAGEDLGSHIEEDIVAGGNNESVISNGNTEGILSEHSQRTENDLDQSTLSQQREAAARQERYRRLLPSLTDDGFEAALAGNSQPAPAESAALVRRRDSHRSSDDSASHDSASHDSETVDFDKFMRRILPPPPKNKEPTTTVQSQDPMTAEKQGEGPVKQQAAGMEELATSIPLPLPTSPKILVESMQPPPEKSIPVLPLNSKLSFRPTSPQEEESYNTETVLPLTLDTQLHRPGILSPNFKLRIKSTRKNPAVLHTDAKDPTTPKKRQRFATQLITPGKQPNPSLASSEASRTPQHRVIPNPDYKSPESMIENVETLATWSPAKYETQRLTGTGQEQWGMDDEEKENQPPQTRPLESAGSRGPQSLDEIIEGTYGHIQSFHLLDTYHRGYTPRKESAVVARENALPRTIKRLLLPTEPKPAFAEVDQAWAGLESEAPHSKASSLRKAPPKKVETAEQSTLGQHGFLKNDNARKSRAIDFGRRFEDEDNVIADDEDFEEENDRESSSPTPRKASASRILGTVPAPPFDPRLKPAGVREIQRREKLRETKQHQIRRSESEDGAPKDDGSVVNRGRPADRSDDDHVPSSQAYENQDAILRSDSTNEMELQVNVEWLEEMRQMYSRNGHL